MASEAEEADEPDPLPVAVIGAGPVGLAAAAHLVARGIEPLVFEAGETVGASVREWGHVRVFSPWAFNIDPVARELLDAHDWSAPDADGYPTGDELVERYLEPLASVGAIASALRLRSRVVAVTRRGLDKLKDAERDAAAFELVVDEGGLERRVLARAVIDASGTWRQPNPLGSGGVVASGERTHADRISYGIPDILGRGPRSLCRPARRRGGKRALGLQRDPRPGRAAGFRAGDADRVGDPRRRAGPQVWRRRRRSAPGQGRPRRHGPRARRAGGGRTDRRRFTRATVDTADGRLMLSDGERRITADEVIAATGFRPDLSILRELRLDLDDRSRRRGRSRR